jgi:hypothetical protein
MGLGALSSVHIVLRSRHVVFGVSDNTGKYNFSVEIYVKVVHIHRIMRGILLCILL